MGYRELGKRAYREWVSQSGYTITRKQFKTMSTKDKQEFREGFWEARSRKATSEVEVRSVYSEFEKNLLTNAK